MERRGVFLNTGSLPIPLLHRSGEGLGMRAFEELKKATHLGGF
jgi:hypothetical protein